jgi:Ni,Fe-hydrogenase I small subunit
MKNLERFIELNEGRSMQLSLRDENGVIVESTNVVVCGSYSFIGKVNDNHYQAISIDPINYEQKIVDLPRCAVNDNIVELIEKAQA